VGLGPNVLSLYRQMKILGLFEGITDVAELGSQGVWCPDKRTLVGLFEAFDRPLPPDSELAPYLQASGTGHASSRHLHESLGFKYDCIDIDAKFGSITLDLNFDSIPGEWRNRFGLVTNHGTTEHLMNQVNAFQVMHDLTKPCGLMLHAVPYSHVEHGFFNYQPNFYYALARYNSYETLGVWLGIDWQLSSFVPWEPKLLEFLAFNHASTHLLVVLQRKLYNTDFRIPVQGVYEPMLPEESLSRYELVVDGEYYSGRRIAQITRAGLAQAPQPTPLAQPATPTLEQIPSRVIASHLVSRILRRLKNELTGGR
jgi:SAM-dependent methyltransferase